MTRYARSMALAMAAVLGCGGSGGGDGTTTPAAEPVVAEPAGAEAGGETAPAAGPSAAEQIAAGQAVWDASCVSCHKYGSKGNELDRKFDRSGVKNAAELVAFIKEKMPKDDPGTLSDEQAWAVTAAILSKLELIGDTALTAETAAAISIE